MSDRHEQQAAGTHPAPCARHCEAQAFKIEIRRLEAENAELRDYVGDGLLRSDYKSAAEMRVEIKRLCEEVMHLRIYAPGQHQPHQIRMAPHVGPTDFAAWGITPDTEDATE